MLGAYRFGVELYGMLAAGFSEVSGLESQTEYEEYREGGVNGYVHRLPKGVRTPPIVLRRGISYSPELWIWYDQASQGRIARVHGSIILYKPNGREQIRWNIFDAYPVKWTGPTLNASASEIAIESVEIVHNGIKPIYWP